MVTIRTCASAVVVALSCVSLLASVVPFPLNPSVLYALPPAILICLAFLAVPKTKISITLLSSVFFILSVTAENRAMQHQIVCRTGGETLGSLDRTLYLMVFVSGASLLYCLIKYVIMKLLPQAFDSTEASV